MQLYIYKNIEKVITFTSHTEVKITPTSSIIHCKNFDRINPCICKGALIFRYSLRINHYKINPLVIMDLHLNPCSIKDFPASASRKNPGAITEFKSRSVLINGMNLPKSWMEYPCTLQDERNYPSKCIRKSNAPRTPLQKYRYEFLPRPWVTNALRMSQTVHDIYWLRKEI